VLAGGINVLDSVARGVLVLDKCAAAPQCGSRLEQATAIGVDWYLVSSMRIGLLEGI